MSDIPTDIFLEILRRVPVELLLQFRSVCKTWRSIIDDPAFAKQHIHHGIGGQWFFHKHDKNKNDRSCKIFLLPIKELIYSNTSNGNRYIVAKDVKSLVDYGLSFPVLSCNGLILVSSREYLARRIWNPFTGESLELGQFELSNKFYCSGSGIGYDQANDDYKVVNIVRSDIYVYTVNSKKWRKIDEQFPCNCIMQRNGVFAYGALHWLTREKTGNVWFIDALDLSTEKCRKIVLPSDIFQEICLKLALSALSGCLFLTAYFRGGKFAMWMSRNYGNEDMWVKKISLYEEKLITPLAYLRSKEQVLLQCDGRNYVWYDMEKNNSVISNIDVDAYYRHTPDTFSSHFFPASLIRLKRSGVSERVSSQVTSKRNIERAEWLVQNIGIQNDGLIF